MPTLDQKIPPPVVGALTAAAMWGLSALGPQASIPAGLKYAAVATLGATGIAFSLSGILAFRALGTSSSPLPSAQCSALVTGGVYRISRNPMYLGVACLLLAWAVFLSALLPVAGLVAYVLYITRFQILPEERVLAEIFGEQYTAYAARVRRWL